MYRSVPYLPIFEPQNCVLTLIVRFENLEILFNYDCKFYLHRESLMAFQREKLMDE